jgi:hypothetical protein
MLMKIFVIAVLGSSAEVQFSPAMRLKLVWLHHESVARVQHATRAADILQA